MTPPDPAAIMARISSITSGADAAPPPTLFSACCRARYSTGAYAAHPARDTHSASCVRGRPLPARSAQPPSPRRDPGRAPSSAESPPVPRPSVRTPRRPARWRQRASVQPLPRRGNDRDATSLRGGRPGRPHPPMSGTPPVHPLCRGAKTMSVPASPASLTSRPRSRGYLSKSSPAPNCVGLTKIVVTTTSARLRAVRMRCR